MTAKDRKKLKEIARQEAEKKVLEEKSKVKAVENIPSAIMQRLERMDELQGGGKNARKKQMIERIVEKYKDF